MANANSKVSQDVANLLGLCSARSDRPFSASGLYEVEIRNSNATARASARGDAKLRNFVSTLEVAVSLRDLSPGSYSLAVRRDRNEWEMFPLQLR
jgi:hypothetical protein